MIVLPWPPQAKIPGYAPALVDSITVGILWATVITVQLLNSVYTVFWIIESVALSIDAVASSSTSI